MSKPRVLQIGMDPAVIDFSPWPGQDAEHLRGRIAEAEGALRRAGFEVTVCLVPDDVERAETTLRGFLDDQTFDVVEVGSGMRTSHEFTPIFERVINTVTALRPDVRFCFNDSPETTLDAVRRVLASRDG